MNTIFVGDVNQQCMSRVLTVSFQHRYHKAVFISSHNTKKMLEPSWDTFILCPNSFVARCGCSWRS